MTSAGVTRIRLKGALSGLRVRVVISHTLLFRQGCTHSLLREGFYMYTYCKSERKRPPVWGVLGLLDSCSYREERSYVRLEQGRTYVVLHERLDTLEHPPLIAVVTPTIICLIQLKLNSF